MVQVRHSDLPIDVSRKWRVLVSRHRCEIRTAVSTTAFCSCRDGVVLGMRLSGFSFSTFPPSPRPAVALVPPPATFVAAPACGTIVLILIPSSLPSLSLSFYRHSHVSQLPPPIFSINNLNILTSHLIAFYSAKMLSGACTLSKWFASVN